MESLLRSYKQTLKSTKGSLERLKNSILELELIIEDKKNQSIHNRNAAAADLQPMYADKTLLNGMISDLEYAITWMKTGHQPGARRGVERLASYQRERPFDPMLMQRFHRSNQTLYAWDTEPKEYVITPSEKELVAEALAALSDKEREVYLMSRGHCLSMGDIAKKMNLAKSTIQTMLKRSDVKIGKIVAAKRKEES